MDNPEIRSVLTNWGVIRLDIDDRGIVRCALPRLAEIPRSPFAVLECGVDPYSRFVKQLLEGGNPEVPPIGRVEGTAFQLDVWKGVSAIPRGKTCSYLELSAKVGNPRAIRAVANACGRNPLPLFIPCHRVIRSDGNIGGYSAGTAWKRLLLAVEQAEYA